MFLCFYVDDVIFTGSNLKMIGDFKHIMMKEFEMTDLGLMSSFWALKSSKETMESSFVKGNLLLSF